MAEQDQDRPRPCRWQIVITDAGPHVRLVGANGETVLWSQVYAGTRSATDAVVLARAASTEPATIVDERTDEPRP